MRRRLVSLMCSLLIFAPGTPAGAADLEGGKLRIIAFGGHPDDCEIRAAGVAAMWAAAGHAVKFVSLTNGDIGHFGMAGGPLAQRRKAEAKKCAEILGIESEVLDIHDGELMPTLENRKTVARLIREWQADIVLFHRPCDYHADHRYTGVLVEDASVLVTAPFFIPDTAPVKRNPVLLYFYDRFEKPVPFEPTIVVSIDRVAEKKWDCIRAMPSQFADRDAWQARTAPNVPEGDQQRAEFLLQRIKQRSADMADRYREQLIEAYGPERGARIRYAEAFEVCQYGRQPELQELRMLFPIEYSAAADEGTGRR